MVTNNQFFPFTVEDEQAGTVLIGLKCGNCSVVYDSADLVMDTQMFTEAINHACNKKISPRFHGLTATGRDPVDNLTI